MDEKVFELIFKFLNNNENPTCFKSIGKLSDIHMSINNLNNELSEADIEYRLRFIDAQLCYYIKGEKNQDDLFSEHEYNPSYKTKFNSEKRQYHLEKIKEFFNAKQFEIESNILNLIGENIQSFINQGIVIKSSISEHQIEIALKSLNKKLKEKNISFEFEQKRDKIIIIILN